MILSEDKISHLSHIILKGLVEKRLIEMIEEESKIRREIKRTIIAELKMGEEIDSTVRKKIRSFSRKMAEGGPEWEVLYRKFFKEEEAKRGLT